MPGQPCLLGTVMSEATKDARVLQFFPLGEPHPQVLSAAQIRQFNEI